MNIGILFSIVIFFVIGKLDGRFLLVQVGNKANVRNSGGQFDDGTVKVPIRQGRHTPTNDIH